MRKVELLPTRDCEAGYGPAWWGNWGPALDHKLFLNNLIRLHCTLSNLLAPNFDCEVLDDMQPEKEYMGPQFPIVRLIFQRLCDDNQCLICFIFFLFLSLSLRGLFSSWAPGHRLPMPPSGNQFRAEINFQPKNQYIGRSLSWF